METPPAEPVLPGLHVVIPVHNGGEQLLMCLESLSAMDYPQSTVVLIDNASSDGSIQRARVDYPETTILTRSSNEGFAVACNAGISFCVARGSTMVLVLNQDTRVAPDMARALVGTMIARPEAALIAPKTYAIEPPVENGRRLLYAGGFYRRWPLRFHLPGVELTDNGRFDEPLRVDVAWGHALLLRTEALAHVGLFDTRFFLYHEDVDLCRRLRAAGYELWYEPAAVVWHAMSDSDRARESEAWRWRIKVESTWRFHRKYSGAVAGALLTLVTEVHELVHLFRHGHLTAAHHVLCAVLQWPFAARPRVPPIP